jgi:succinate dehydrogenase hydrophobic anchor subunit
MVAAVSSTSSSCIQFQLGVQIIFITFFTKHCWHSWFVMGVLSDDMSLSSKEKKTVFGAVVVVVVVVVVVMGLGFTMTVVVQRIYAGGKDWMIA